MAKQEYEGVAFTSAMKDGWQVSVTERAGGSAEAVANLEATIELMKAEGYVPFVNTYNKAPSAANQTEGSLVETAKELGGVEKLTTEEKNSIAEGCVEVPEGHNYLGIKPGKLEEINANDSYQVRADVYSYDGTWVNFFYGDDSMSVAGHYYNSKIGQKVFTQMFKWEPVMNADKKPIPGGDVLLYILGVKGKNSDDIYHNIKQVDPA